MSIIRRSGVVLHDLDAVLVMVFDEVGRMLVMVWVALIILQSPPGPELVSLLFPGGPPCIGSAAQAILES